MTEEATELFYFCRGEWICEFALCACGLPRLTALLVNGGRSNVGMRIYHFCVYVLLLNRFSLNSVFNQNGDIQLDTSTPIDIATVDGQRRLVKLYVPKDRHQLLFSEFNTYIVFPQMIDDCEAAVLRRRTKASVSNCTRKALQTAFSFCCLCCCDQAEKRAKAAAKALRTKNFAVRLLQPFC